MSMIRNWFGTMRPVIHADAYTLSTRHKFQTVGDWIRKLTGQGQQVLVLCHFQSTFLQTQAALDEQSLDHDILASRISEDEMLARLRRGGTAATTLTLVPMLQSAGPAKTDSRQPGPPLAIIVVERHPLAAEQKRLLLFARNLNCRVAIGYILSFDDPVVRFFLGEPFIGLMRQLGMGDHDLISSAMTRKALSRAMRRQTSGIRREIPAESPEQWLHLNLPRQG